ncbi:polyadenylate-binding protein-interacting protein 1 isoform X1 [Osmerus eperlanus]|uniref:polyadenylate-binding protein-interacting protein 1 isoform X1 n=1 Tax=Osmerus eperlanus TaxID=29151 RepID=UPI002E135C7B
MSNITENFDRAPGAGRTRQQSTGAGGGDRDAKTYVFNQREPLRQPRTSPPLVENNTGSGGDAIGGDGRRAGKQHPATHTNNSTPASQGRNLDLVKTSTLSVNAKEFVPTTSQVSQYEVYDEEPVWEDGSDGFYGGESLSDMVEEFLAHLSSSPGSFETDVEHMAYMLNSWVTTEELLQDLVELIYTQSTAIPNFAYTGARLCNYLSHNITISPASGNFRQLLLKRCRTEYEQRDVAVKGNEKTQKSFHCYVLFLGELYLNLEVKSAKGPPCRAEILQNALKELMNALFSNPVDGNLICAVKLLKLTGSVLEDTWKKAGKSDMDQLIQRTENIVLDATCSRWDVKQMLLRLVELRSSNWGRVLGAAAASDATPDNDPNYFMNEPTFYTTDGTPFTAADPEYSEKYQEILDRGDWEEPDLYEENGSDSLFDEDEMDPEIEEAFEKFCLESEMKRKQ